jgi:hypothetical protein
MAKPSRRVHARYPCDMPAALYSPMSSKKLADVRVLDLSMGGASVEVPLQLQKGVPYELRMEWERTEFHLTARVAWTMPPNPKKPKENRFGLSFNLSTQQEALLKILVDRLRQDHWPERKDASRDYWSV